MYEMTILTFVDSNKEFSTPELTQAWQKYDLKNMIAQKDWPKDAIEAITLPTRIEPNKIKNYIDARTSP